MALLNFKYGAQSGLAGQSFAAGTVYITSDTKKLFVDNPNGSSGRVCLGDFQLVSWTKSDTVTSPATALTNYPLKDANTLYITVESTTGATAMWRYSDSAFVAISNSEEIADIVADIAAINTALSGKAPTSHASTATTYGVGSGSYYGHVKLSDATNSSDDATKSIAATPKAVKAAYDRGTAGVNAAATAQAAAEAADAKAVAAQSTADGAATAAAKAQEEVDALETVVAGKADKSHASSNTTYGIGTSSNYGHVKLTDAINTTQTNGQASKGIAASAYAVKLAYDRGSTGITNAATAQSTADGAATAAANANTNANGRVSKAGDTMTGALTLSGAPTADLHAATKAYVDGQAASAKSGAEATAQGYVDALKGTSADAATAITVYGAIAKAAAAGTAASNAQTTASNALPKAGGTMTGFITLHAAPTSNMHAATKKYVDDAKSSAVSTAKGTTSDASTVISIYGARKYTDEKIAGVNSTISTLQTSIGNLSNIMNFLGTTTTALKDGSTTSSITIGGSTVTAKAGDVVVNGNKEFVFDGSKWAEIGDVSAQSTAITNLESRVDDAEGAIGGLQNMSDNHEQRIVTLENWKTSHSTQYTNLSGTVSSNTTAINNLTTVLTWGTF